MRRLCLLLSSVLGCADFDHPSTVEDLRVLAMAAEPSEVILEPGGSIPPIALTALVVDPAGTGRPLAFTVRACANDPFAPGAPGAGSEASGNYPAGGARSSVGSGRCPPEGPTSWTLPVPVTAGPEGHGFSIQLTEAQLRAAFAADVFPGPSGKAHGGFDLGLPITVELSVDAGSERVAAIKRVLFWPARLAENHRPNRTPIVGEVQAYADRDPLTLLPIGPREPLAPEAPRPVVVDARPWIEPAGAEAEPYVTTVIDRFTDEARPHQVGAETLRYQFFTTAGKFDPWETTSELPFGATPAGRVPIEARYQPPEAEALPVAADGKRSQEVTIWIVVRDERGGASWTRRRLLVSER